jgi:hypothetical protein
MNRLYRQFGILDISQPYTSPWPVIGIALPLFCVVFTVCSVSFIVCVVLCAVFCLFVCCVILVTRVICMLCLIVVPLPLGEDPFEVQINNNNNNNNNNNIAFCDRTPGSIVVSYQDTKSDIREELNTQHCEKISCIRIVTFSSIIIAIKTLKYSP